MLKSIGIMTFPTEWKNKNVPNCQTTNQLCFSGQRFPSPVRNVRAATNREAEGDKAQQDHEDQQDLSLGKQNGISTM